MRFLATGVSLRGVFEKQLVVGRLKHFGNTDLGVDINLSMLVGVPAPSLGSGARPEAATFSAGAIHFFFWQLVYLLPSVTLLALS